MRKLFLLLFLIAFSSLAEAREWKFIGPRAGSIARIIPDRRNPKVFYLATGDRVYISRLYRSENGGHDWHRVAVKLPLDFAVHPETSGLYVISTVFNREKGYDTDALSYSNDGGRSFQVRFADFSFARRIFLDRYNVNRLFATDSFTLSVSNDGGRTWTEVAGFPYRTGDKLPPSLGGCRATNYFFTDLIVSPNSSSEIFLSGYLNSVCGHDEKSVPITLESTNDTRSWRVLENRNYNFYWDPIFPNRVFATNEGGIKKLQGNAFVPIAAIPLDTIVQDPRSESVLFGLRRKYYNTPARLFFSSDSGKSWTAANETLDGSFFALTTSQDGALIAGTSGAGVFRKMPGEDWKEASGGLDQPLSINIVQNRKGSHVYSLVDGRYVFDTVDASSNWKALLSSLPVIGRHFQARIFADPKEARTVMLDFDFGPLILSQDFGETWQSLGKFSNPAFDPQMPQIVYLTGSGKVWKSVEGGLNPKPLPLKFKRPFIRTVVDPFDSSTLYFLTRQIYKSTDGGRTMKLLTSQFKYPLVMAALPVPNSFLLAYGGTVYKTTDGGVNWTALSDRLNFIHKIAVVTASHLFMHSSSGLLESTDGGKNWTNVNAEFGREFIGDKPHQFVSDIGDARGLYFYVATSKGVFVTVLK